MRAASEDPQRLCARMIAYPIGQEPDFFDPDPGNDAYRFALGRIRDCTVSAPPFVVVGMNPSHARETASDKTVNHVIEVSRREHRGWLMLNLYPERSPKPKDLAGYKPELSAANCDAIERVLIRFGVTEVLGGWGDLGGSATLKRALPDVLALLDRMGVRVFTLDPLTKAGKNPRHPHPPGRPLPMLGPKEYL
ncbi:DUF1643 domain-containing protein [Microbacterium sp. NIBRBAC000506063]|uniref:DUF1643 domain-containing protein n=1 Tax=Microbacterium sp. NIBRBAC000506063 TaxID=2734618 RepID=UPI001BB7F7CC|nr:DUF1643 domain-containing protein [Microbacterium sp. NIBRBAC000506063]QTV80770.1 DUF1643 domain-containing protein [Microbacterium sp. NIBRBAC000506063]